MVQEAAFLSLIAPDRNDRRHYAQVAYEVIWDIYENPEQERLPHSGYGLSRAMMQLALALPYAWSSRYWTAGQKHYVFTKINGALDAWLSYDHANFWRTRGSNWTAVCRGGELVLLLASGQREQRRKRYDFLIEQLVLHIRNGYGSLGVSQEGIGYTEYGGQFLLKAVHAAASMGDSTLLAEARQKAWWKQAMYLQSFQEQGRKYLMTGVAGPGAYNEGWASLLLPLTPVEELPYFLWWYDRRIGRLSPGNLRQRFDHQRAGAIWSVLYYPADVTSRDPTGIYPAGVADDHGYYFFRNRWRDEHDILLSIMADEEHHSHAWDQPEVFALNLAAHNTRYIGGPNKGREQDLYSTLLVDGQYNVKGSVRLTGKTLDWETGPDQGFVAVDGGLLYDSLGLDLARRQLALQFLEENRAVICVMDTVSAAEEHRYTWQLNLGDHEQAEDLQVSTGNRRFRIRSAEGQVDGWVINPQEFEFGPETDPFQFHFSGRNDRVMVVLLVHDGQGEIPELVREGEGYYLQNYRIGYNEQGRLIIARR